MRRTRRRSLQSLSRTCNKWILSKVTSRLAITHKCISSFWRDPKSRTMQSTLQVPILVIKTCTPNQVSNLIQFPPRRPTNNSMLYQVLVEERVQTKDRAHKLLFKTIILMLIITLTMAVNRPIAELWVAKLRRNLICDL